MVGHIQLAGDSIVRFLSTQHYRRNYLYAEHESGKAVTLIDVTNIAHPSLLADVDNLPGGADALVEAAGNAALISTIAEKTERSERRAFRIMSFANPQHPTVQQEFKDVTAVARDDKRGLIFLANSDGVWILRQQYAPDPETEKEWEHMMLDAR